MPVDSVEFCKALADETRQHILEMLLEGELCVTEIVGAFDISQPTISHHLDVLSQLGLLTSRKAGRQVYYATDRDRVLDCCGELQSRFGLATQNWKSSGSARSWK